MAEIYKIGSDDLIDRVSTFGGTNLLVDTWLATNQYGLSNCTASIVADASAPIKSVVRLTRDNEGNYSYSYTADSSAVDDAA